MIRKCKHGIYWPDDQALPHGCQFCNIGANMPDEPGAQKFVLPRSINLGVDIDINRCPKCSSPLLSSFGAAYIGRCVSCNEDFMVESRNPSGRANTRQAGSCPDCGSAIHIETDNKLIWSCADCGKDFPAAKRISE